MTDWAEFCFTGVLFQGKQTWLIQKHVLIGKIIVTDWVCNSNNGEWTDNEQLEVRADDAAGDEKKKDCSGSVHGWYSSERQAWKKEGGKAEGISPSPYATPSLWGFSPWTYWIFLSRSSSWLFGFRHFQHSSHLSTDNHYQSTGTSTEGQDFWPIRTLAYWGEVITEKRSKAIR